MKYIIVDDEKNAQEVLKRMIATHCSEMINCGIANNAQEARVMIAKTQPDLVFLDIEMPRESGFNLLDSIEEHNFLVIFTTAYNAYAIQAIRCSAIDYLLKPIQPEELKTAVDRVKTEIEKKSPIETALKTSNLNQMLAGGSARIALSDNEGTTFVAPDDILYVKSESNYAYVYFKNGSKRIYAKTLKEFEGMLENLGFFRSHRSYLANVKYIQRFDYKDGGTLTLIDGTEIAVSSQKKQALFSLLT